MDYTGSGSLGVILEFFLPTSTMRSVLISQYKVFFLFSDALLQVLRLSWATRLEAISRSSLAHTQI